MAIPRVMSGARAIVNMAKGDNPSVVMGIFSRFDYSAPLDAQGAWILGKLAAASIDYTAAELVGINAQGWRVIGAGAHAVGGVPKLQDMLTADYITFTVIDRVTGAHIATIENVRATQHSQSFGAKLLSEMPINYVGILVSDESGPSVEPPGGADLPF